QPRSERSDLRWARLKSTGVPSGGSGSNETMLTSPLARSADSSNLVSTSQQAIRSMFRSGCCPARDVPMGEVGRRGNWLATREHGLLRDLHQSEPRVLAVRRAAWPAVEYAAAGYPAGGDDAVAREPGVRAARQPVARRPGAPERPDRRLRSEQFALRWVA